VVAVLLAGAGVVAPQPAAAGPQGSLRAADPTLVRDGDTWVSLATNESLSAPFAQACNPSDPVWTKGFAYVPYRTGPAPDRLGDCYAGDALPGGPGPWADRPPDVGMLQWAPSIARIDNVWWLFYAARNADTGQQCIGVAAGDRSTGPNWLHPAQPLVCPAGGNWAIDPEIFYDRQSRAWYLLWRQDPGLCESRLYVQRFDTGTVALTGPVRQLLTTAHPALGFDEFAGAPSCPGGLKQIIENPAMVRADSGQLWLFFSANAWDSLNYATGWAVCGTGAPTDGGGCGIVNAFPGESRNRPLWGSSVRTAVTPENPKPFLGFPDLPGFGGMSLAAADPTAPGIQRVYATAHLFWGDPSKLRTQVVYRLDTSGVVPGLLETEPLTVHGKAGTFGTVGAQTPSGQASATRAVPGFGFPPGRSAYFSAVAADGTVFTGGIDHNFNYIYMTADDMVVAAYDPKYHTYRNINIRTTTGKEAIADLHGASIADVEAVSGGNGIAFTGPVSWRGQDASVDGEWPAFGILTKVAGQWQVTAGNQWTGGQLARSNPPVSALACPPEADHPDVSQCGGPNEMDTLPASGHVIIAQYFSGLMALDLRGPDTSGRYDPRVAGAYPPLKVKDVTTPDPDDEMVLAPRDVQADPTGVLGDERFALMFDAYFPAGSKLEAAGFIEFSYDARTGQIRPVSGPILRGDRNAEGRFWGNSAWYDHQGNLWAPSSIGFHSGRLGVYAKRNGQRKIGGPACPFDPARPWQDYLLTSGDHAAWGQVCRPDYDILQPSHQLASWGLVEDPASHTIVYQITGGHAMPIRVSGSGLAMTFTIGQLVDVGDGLLPKVGPIFYPLGAFDTAGRLLQAAVHDPTATEPRQLVDQWFLSLDVAQLFAPAPVRLPAVAGQSATVQAEYTTTGSTVQRSGQVATVDVDSTAYLHNCVTFWTETCADDGVPGDGFMLADDSGSGVLGGTVTYQVWAPAAGQYRVAYRARTPSAVTGGQIRLTIGGSSQVTPVNTGNAWQTVTGPTVALAAGLNTLSLSPTAGGGGWYLNFITLTRV
jgi:hypothetical protein